MKRLLTMAVFALLALAQPALAQTVLDSDFNIDITLPDGEVLRESTTLVPLMPGACYNWRLQLGKVKTALDITEVYTLPAAPQSWELGEDSTIVISDDKLSATSSLKITPLDGWIQNGWCVAAGDPEGAYSFDIFSGGTLLHRFAFEVRAL